MSCRALGVSQAWFYKWCHSDGSPRRARRKALAATIGYLFAKHKRTYGSPRITADLRDMGAGVGEHRRGADARAGSGSAANAAGTAPRNRTNPRVRPPICWAETFPRATTPTSPGWAI
ncbi:IS3 family transposase [Mycobacterium canetti]|uniref:IS3 family transposase n=1 Tax=Mycobacterium canetti TaxID=78331 RepID=UPI002E1DE049